MRYIALAMFSIAVEISAAGGAFAASLPAKNRSATCSDWNVGVGEAFPPYLFTVTDSDGKRTKAIGLDIDLIVEIRSRLCEPGRRDAATDHIRLFQVPFPELFERLKQRQFDIIVSGITTGEPLQQREDVIYSYPYLTSGLALAVRDPGNQSAPADASEAIQPNHGRTAGGEPVMIRGNNLAGASVKIGGKYAQISRATSTEVVFTTPPHAAEIVDVTLTTTAGNTTLANSFTYADPPSFAEQTQTAYRPCSSDLLAPYHGQRVVVERGSQSEETAATFGMKPVPSPSASEPTVAMTSGVNLILGDIEVLRYYARRGMFNGWRILQCEEVQNQQTALVPFRVTRAGNSVAVRKGDIDLLLEINRTINDLLNDEYVDKREDAWNGYVPGGQVPDEAAPLRVTTSSFADEYVRRSKAELAVKPPLFEKSVGSKAFRQITTNLTLSWLLPVNWTMFNDHFHINYAGPELAYSYKRKTDSGVLGKDRVYGPDLNAKFEFGPLPSLVGSTKLKFLTPTIAIGFGHRHTDSEYSVGETPKAGVSERVFVWAFSIPLMPTLHGFTPTIEFKDAAKLSRLGQAVDESIGFGISYKYPH